MLPSIKRRFFLKCYANSLKNICGLNLLAVIITGSASSKQNIEGWSDIDLIVILNKLEPSQLILIGRLGEVGISVVSISDWKKKILNPKVKYALTQKIRFLYGGITVPKIKLKEISGDYKTILNFYHDDLIKCATRGVTSKSAKKAVKFVFINYKVVAREYGQNLNNYKECIEFAKSHKLDYNCLDQLDKFRYQWSKISDFETVIVVALKAGEEIFTYGKKLF